MDNKTKITLADFSKKAMQRLEDKALPKSVNLHIPSLDCEITIRNLSKAEIVECFKMEDTDDDQNKSDRYSIYLAVTEPNLKEVAVELKNEGKIKEYLDVIDIFDMHEVTSIASEIMKLSGVIGSKKVAVVEALKN